MPEYRKYKIFGRPRGQKIFDCIGRSTSYSPASAVGAFVDKKDIEKYDLILAQDTEYSSKMWAWNVIQKEVPVTTYELVHTVEVY